MIRMRFALSVEHNALERAQVLVARLARGHRDAIRDTKAFVNKLLRDARRVPRPLGAPSAY